MKSKRQRKIIDLIGEYDIDTQEPSSSVRRDAARA